MDVCVVENHAHGGSVFHTRSLGTPWPACDTLDCAFYATAFDFLVYK
jgi:hypothetical protein